MRGKQLIWKQIQTKAKPLINPNIVPTFDIFPSSVDYKDENIPLGLVLKPFGIGQHLSSDHVPEVCFGIKGIIRCQICKSYMNPYNYIDLAKSSYYCCLCGWYNTLPTNYNLREDNVQLNNLTYDIVPFKNQFSNKKLSQPHIIFLVQATYDFLRSEAYEMLLSAVQYCLQSMNQNQNVMLITYDSSCVSTYDLRGQGTRYLLSLDQKPMNQSLSREVKEVKDNFIKILRTLPELYQTPNYEKKNILSRRGMQYSIQCLFKIGGKILHFLQNHIPAVGITNAPKNRQQGFYSNTSYYQRIGKICNEHTISYNIFLFSNVQSNVIQVADLCLLTKGSFKLYRKQDPVQQFYYDLIESLVQNTAYTATSRLRHSCYTIESTIKTTLSNQWELSWPSKNNNFAQLLTFNTIQLDTFVAITVNLNTLIKDKYFILQNSCLYINPDGKTKLRVSNSAIPLSDVLVQVHHSANYQGLSTYFIKNQIQLLIKNRGVVKSMEERIVSLCKRIIHYKKYQWTHDVIFLCLGLLKNRIAVKQKGMMFSKKRLEQMWINLISILAYNPSQTLTCFIPQLFKVTQDQSQYLPPLLPLINTSIQPNSVYVMLCGKRIIVYYSQNYEGPRLYSQDSTISTLIQQLSSLNNYKHYKVKQTEYNSFSQQAYQEFMNYLLYSDGLYQTRCTYQEFLQLFI